MLVFVWMGKDNAVMQQPDFQGVISDASGKKNRESFVSKGVIPLSLPS
jgi:hypothetical protein